MIESRSRFAYTSLIGRRVLVSADLISDTIGVIPLPPPNITSGRSSSPRRSTNRPSGGFTAICLPVASSSLNQFETRPRSTRFTVTLGSGSQSGALDSE